MADASDGTAAAAATSGVGSSSPPIDSNGSTSAPTLSDPTNASAVSVSGDPSYSAVATYTSYPPPNAVDASSGSSSGSGEQVRTIFVSGWPGDIKQREVHNLFRFQPGFEVALLNNRGKVPVAFITFKEHDNAELAMAAFQGLRFDVDQPGTELRVELAKTTSFIPGQGPPGAAGKKRASDEVDADDYADKRSRSAASGVLGAGGRSSSGKHGTLYVVNIGPNVTEEELRETFSGVAGFRALKVKPIRGGTAVVAWVDYATHESAQHALDTLQGHRLPAGLGPALKIEFANSPMNINAIREGSVPSGSKAAVPPAHIPDPYAQPYGGYYYPPPGYPMFPPPHGYPPQSY